MKVIIDNDKKLVFTPSMPITFFDFFTKKCNTKEKFFKLLDEFEDYLLDSYKFCLNWSNEGFDCNEMMESFIRRGLVKENPFNWMLEYKKDKNHFNPFFSIMTGNLNIKNTISSHLEEFYHPVLNMHQIPKVPSDIGDLYNRNIDKKFVCLNARVNNRFYRTAIYTFLKSINALEESNYSYNTRGDFQDYPQIWYEKQHELNQIEEEFGDKLEAIENPSDSPFINSFCNIVTETYFDGNYDDSYRGSFFMSEKVYKPMISCQPFLMVSMPFYLQNMKEYGFKTFSDYWDESYDNCESGVDRLSMICKIIDDLSQKSLQELKEMYIDMIPILEHNFKHTFKLPELYPELSNPRRHELIESKVMKELLES